MKTNFKKIAVDGVVKQNPTLKLVLGTCPTLALTTLAMNCIGMGLAVTFVLICSNVLVSLLRNRSTRSSPYSRNRMTPPAANNSTSEMISIAIPIVVR